MDEAQLPGESGSDEAQLPGGSGSGEAQLPGGSGSGEVQLPGGSGSDDPLVECIRNGIYAAVGLGLLAVNRFQAARQDWAGQMPDDLRDSLAGLADQIPEDIRYSVTDLARQLPESVRTVLSDAVEQAPAIAAALREILRQTER